MAFWAKTNTAAVVNNSAAVMNNFTSAQRRLLDELAIIAGKDKDHIGFLGWMLRSRGIYYAGGATRGLDKLTIAQVQSLSTELRAYAGRCRQYIQSEADRYNDYAKRLDKVFRL